MPFYACPNCGSSISSAADAAPAACPGCCALLHVEDDLPAAAPIRQRRPRPMLRMPLGSDRHSPSSARHALGELRPELGEARYEICQLLVSELVTNVLRHTRPGGSLAASDMRVRLYGDRIRIEVRDDGPGFTPRPRAVDDNSSSGWGLQIVDQLADDWGVERGVQNCVWFELGRTPLASGQHAVAPR
jgi:anti-sigma regulatory factor (Ser/Thr protein kinase)